METVHEVIRKQVDDYIDNPIKQGKYVDFDMHETIETITAYLNSKHTSGLYDSQGREKPFYNIVVAAANIWFRATDLDRKNIRVKAKNRKQTIPAFVATILLNDWMKKTNYGKFLNDWGKTLARYGSAISKYVEQNGELIPKVIQWNRLIVDPVDIHSAPIVEKLYRTEAQLRANKSYDQKIVDQMVDSKMARRTLDDEVVDENDNFFELYEVHHEFPLSMLTGKEKDRSEFVQQMHVISYQQTNSGSFDDFTLFKGREEKSPYIKDDLIEEDGRTLAIGAVEYLFDAQWMKNNTIKNEKDQLDLASKLFFQTSDSSFVGQNAITDIEQGDILTHEDNKPLTQVNNGSHDIGANQSFGAEWTALAQELTNTPDLARGKNLPSGTTLGEVELLQNQTASLFEMMTENKGLSLETNHMRGFILPYLMKKMNNSDEIASILESSDLTKIDSIYVPSEAAKRGNEVVKKELFEEGKIVSPFDFQAEEESIKQDLAKQGNERFFTPSELKDVKWSDILEDFVWTVEVEITNENIDKAATFSTLTQVLKMVSDNPAMLQDPNAKMLFGKLLEETGRISPVEIAPAAPVAPQNPLQGVEGLSGEVGAITK